MSHLIHVFLRSAILEWRYLKNNRWDQAMLVWVPLFSLLFLWWAFSDQQVHNVPIAVIDDSHSSSSRELIRYLDTSPSIRVNAQFNNKLEAEKALKQRQVYAIVLIPSDFAKNLMRLKPAPVYASINAQYGTHSNIIQTGLRKSVATFSIQKKAKVLIAMGKPYQMLKKAPQPISSHVDMLFNQTSNYRLFISAAVMPALLHILATIAGAYGFGRELRDKSLHAKMRNVRTPLAKQPQSHSINFLSIMAALHGKLFWPMISYSLLEAFSLILITQDQSVSSINWLFCFFNAYLMIAISLWLGVFLSAATLSLRVGLSTTALISAPAFAFSGATFPLSAMPEGAQFIAKCLPLTHYLHTQIALLMQHVSVKMALPNIAGFLIATVILMLLATLFSRRALNKPDRWGAR